MPDIGGGELMIILVVVMVLFGGAQVPKLARGLGQAQREFKKGIEGDKEDRAVAAPPATAEVPTVRAAEPEVVRPDHQS